MSTFDQLTQTVLGNLQGFSLDQDQITYLTSDIGTSDTTLPVGDPHEVSRGLVEVDDELVWVRAVDATSSSALLIPQGRGYMGTTAAAHSANVTVKNNPKYPRVMVKRAINDTIRSLFPDLFKVTSTTFAFTAARYFYPLPAETEDVYDVTWDIIGPSRRWPRLDRWRFVSNANTTSYPTGKALDLMSSVVPGRTVQVTYLVAPQPLVNGSDDFATVTGLNASAEDVVLYGACYRLAGYLDIPRLQTTNVEGNARAQNVPPGSASNTGKYFYAIYKERLAQEREILLARWPRVTHMTRR
jgi:hypothetical protein